ncbi:MAG: type II toxin-antitoxin system VapC family toxin [Patescibacteria group bacterium]
MKRKVVVDASLALKWIPGPREEKVGEAKKIYQKVTRGEIEGWAPNFLALEMLNILIRKRRADPDLAVKGIEMIMEKLSVRELDLRELPRWKILMEKYGVSSYDSLYLRLASELGCKVVSCDKKLIHLKGLVEEL